MVDDKKKNPYDQSQSDDQQKGGQATATDQDVTEVPEGSDVSDVEEDMPVEEDAHSETEHEDEEH